MTLPEPLSWNRAEARAGAFDGRFLMGVLTTGIYCLPSCPARPARPENVRLFETEAAARAAGLRACKRCRPDLYYRGTDEDAALFAGLAARIAAAPQDFPDLAALVRAAGVGPGKLAQVTRRMARLSPAAWLKRQKLAAAETLLARTDMRVIDVALAAGFASVSAFHRHFTARTAMPPSRWRAARRRGT